MIGYSDTCVWVLPVLIAIGVPLTFFATYAIAVAKDHVYPFWPYVSDTGTLPPESCIFGILLNFGSFILVVIMYIRYRQIRSWVDSGTTSIANWSNKVSFGLGLLSCFGLFVVANFQESNQIVVHLLGAFVCFIIGTVYFIIQAVYTRKINKNATWLFSARAILAALQTVAVILCLAPVYTAVTIFDGDDVLQWTSKHKGHSLHVLSTTMEWVTAFAFCFYIGTFFWDFRNIKVSEPKIQVLNLRTKSTRLRSDFEG